MVGLIDSGELAMSAGVLPSGVQVIGRSGPLSVLIFKGRVKWPACSMNMTHFKVKQDVGAGQGLGAVKAVV